MQLNTLTAFEIANTVIYDPNQFANLQAAIDYCETLSGSGEMSNTGVTLLLPPIDLSGETGLIRKHINLIGIAENLHTRVGTITYRPTSAILGPITASIKNISVTNLNVLAETAAASGIFYPDMFSTRLLISECSWTTITANRIYTILIQSCANNSGNGSFTYCENVDFIGCDVGIITWFVNDAAANLPNSYLGGFANFISSRCSFNMTKDGGTVNPYGEAYNSSFIVLTMNGNCDFNLNTSTVWTLTRNGVNNTLTAREGYTMYDPAVTGNWTVEPEFVFQALDELAARESVVDGDKGDITVSASGATWTIDNDAVTNAKAANVPTSTIKGRVTAATGDPEDLTTAQATTLIGVFTSVLKGSAPASGGGTANFLRADGTWAAPAAGSGYNTIEEDGTPLTQRTTINFTGAGVTASDSGGKTVVNIPGGAGSGATGTTTVNFGAFPGASDTSVAVTGQASIVAGSIVNAWIRPVATADHLADEHLVETIKIIAGNIVAATGFTIYAFNTSEKNEIPFGWQQQGNKGGQNGKGTRIYGLWTVQWKWE